MTTQTEAHELVRELEDEAQDNPDDYRWKAAAELRRLEAENLHMDRLMRASVPDQWKSCTSPVGAVQSYIAELEAANADLLEALKMNAQALSWLAFGECRGFTDTLPTAIEATDAARAAIAKHGGQS